MDEMGDEAQLNVTEFAPELKGRLLLLARVVVHHHDSVNDGAGRCSVITAAVVH